MAYVYRHIRLDKNVPFYIGIGNGNRGHIRAKSPLGRSVFWQRIVAKTKYEVEIIMDGLTLEEAKSKEIEFIALYGRWVDGGPLCNLTLGGDGSNGLTGEANGAYGKPVSAERRAKQSATMMGRPSPVKGTKWAKERRETYSRVRKGCKTWNKGLPMNEKQKAAYLKGRPRKEIYQYDLDWKFIKSYPSLTDAAIDMNCTKQNIFESCKNPAKTAKKFRWKYKNEVPCKNTELLSS